jgi:RNA polymerase sigma-70 factor, ECF subfamily
LTLSKTDYFVLLVCKPFKLEKAFIALIQQHAGIIHKVIRLYVSDPEDQRDLQQEILLQAWKSYPAFEGKAAFSTWLYRIALNTVLTFRRKPRVLTQSVEDWHRANGPSIDAEEPRNEDLLLAMRQLTEVDRIILSLHLDGYPNGEIAEITGLQKNHLAVRLHRAKQNVIQGLSKPKP